jgi:diadenosine tetraphosphatase ApaH/serine/threonine PP2A family protein phosphatase
MRLGIFSDVHGNLEALNAVLTAYKEEAIDKYIFLGDAVGYGANPNECCKLIKNITEFSVLGNHDAACINMLSFDWFNPLARDAIIWSEGKLTKNNRKWLEKLDYTIEYQDFLISHGLPLNPEAFEYDDDIIKIKRYFNVLGKLYKVCFIGHTHRPLVFMSDNKSEKIMIDNNNQVKIKLDKKYLINVGSVGQPRDRNPLSCYTIFDTDKMVFTFKRIAYNIEKAAKKIRDANLPDSLAERLCLGI